MTSETTWVVAGTTAEDLDWGRLFERDGAEWVAWECGACQSPLADGADVERFGGRAEAWERYDERLAALQEDRLDADATEETCQLCGEDVHYGDCHDPDAAEPEPCDCGVSRPDRGYAADGGHAADCASRQGAGR